MALTSDEEASVRALLTAVRKLPDVPTWSSSVQLGPVQRALQGLEGFLRQVVGMLRKV